MSKKKGVQQAPRNSPDNDSPFYQAVESTSSSTSPSRLGRGRGQRGQMLAYAAGKRSDGEEGQVGYEEVDRNCQLQEEIRLRDKNMAYMTARTEGLIEQLQTSRGGQVPGASATINPQPESTYDLAAYPPLPQWLKPRSMAAPL